MQSYRKIETKGTCRLNPSAVLNPREIHLYDHMMEFVGESVWIRKNPGAKRGSVCGMSSSARSRLRKAAAKVPKNCIPNFFTTTYQRPISFVEAKRHLDNFGKRMRYHYPAIYMLWRIEIQEARLAKRGEVVPHYHFMIYGGPQIIAKKGANKEVFEWMRRMWCEVSGQMDNDALAAATRYERIKSVRGMHYYVSKYMSKPDDGPGIPGRQWGIIGRQAYKRAVEGGKVVCQVMAESWLEVKKRMIGYLVRVTRRESYRWAPWWSKLSVYGEWKRTMAGWLNMGSLAQMG